MKRERALTNCRRRFVRLTSRSFTDRRWESNFAWERITLKNGWVDGGVDLRLPKLAWRFVVRCATGRSCFWDKLCSLSCPKSQMRRISSTCTYTIGTSQALIKKIIEGFFICCEGEQAKV